MNTSFIITIIAIALLCGAYYAFTGKLAGVFHHQKSRSVQQSFFQTVFTLLGYVARQDGPVNKKEIKRTENYMESMKLDAAQKREAIKLFKIGSAPEFQLKNVTNEFQWLANKSPNLTQILLVYLVNLARVDGLLVKKEIDAVQKIARELGYSNITFEHLLKMISSQDRFNDDPITSGHSANDYSQQNQNQNDRAEKKRGSFSDKNEQSNCAYDALGLSPNASNADVKKAYRALANQFHPDKLIGQGLPPFMVQALTERFKYIQSAYDCIKDSRADN